MTTWHVHRHPIPERPDRGTDHVLRSLVLTLAFLVLFAGTVGFLVGEGLAAAVRLTLGFFDVAGQK